MREEIRPINRLFVRFWVTDNVLPHVEYCINYTLDEDFKYEFIV